MNQSQAQEIYINQVSEVLARLDACESFLANYRTTKSIYYAEAGILQIRKSLECLAYASVAPNKTAYSEFREKAEKQNDFTKDFHAGKIIKMLSKINPNFFPKPVSTPKSVSPGNWHFERREDDSLTKKQFESFYDRLGKFLHADNPWGNDKGLVNILNEIPAIITSTRLLLSWHFTVIRTPDFNGLWVIEATKNKSPTVIIGQADGDFVVNE